MMAVWRLPILVVSEHTANATKVGDDQTHPAGDLAVDLPYDPVSVQFAASY